MTTRLTSVLIDAADPQRLSRFWAELLGWPVTFDDPGEVDVELAPGAVAWGDGGTPCLTFVPVGDPKVGKNRVHLDLVSATDRAQQDTVERALALGAHRIDIGQGDVAWEVLADPEGNEFCVLEPREDYAGARGIAAVVLDCLDPPTLAGFWSQATGWPVVASSSRFAVLQDAAGAATRLELLAVPEPKRTKNRLHLDVAPTADDDLDVEVRRLEAAGARRIDIGQGEVTWVVLADPEGNELCVLTPR